MILITYGTRPEYIKVKPLIYELEKNDIPFRTLFTGQHIDIVPKTADYNFSMINYDGNRLDSVLKNCLSLPNEIFDGVNYILVQGDTTSVVGLALTALHRNIKVIHLEAGLRTYDTQNPFPEENNRRIVSTIADIHLCPTEQNKDNLLKENITSNIFVVGNTGLDNLINLKNSVTTGTKILITLHRRENHHWLDQWFKEINNLSLDFPEYDFIVPLHPNPNVQKHSGFLTNVNIVQPMEHSAILKLLTECKLVITDSGGLQEECSFFDKKCLVCRKVTERPESVGVHSFLVNSPLDLKNEFIKQINNDIINLDCPYGDGFSSKRIVGIFKDLIFTK